MEIQTGEKQLTEYEFEMLAKAGSPLVEKMIMQRVRVSDRMSEDIVSYAMDYVEVNTKGMYYLNREYQRVTVYFADPIDCENFNTVVKSYAKNIS